jgi:DNA-binding HxlR family transcriptional regulator
MLNLRTMKETNKGNCPKSMSECSQKLLPVRDALDILSGKWKLPIIVSLSFGNKRFSAMQKEVAGITARMLSKELRDLEANQLVVRTVYDTKPVTVEYELTKYGKSLQDVIAELGNWGSAHRKRIIGSRKLTEV